MNVAALKTVLLTSSVVAGLALPGAALAADPVATAIGAITPQPATAGVDGQTATDGDDLVVVATRNQATNVQLVADHPVSILSEEDLQHTAVHNVAEALGLMPGVNVVNTGSSFLGGVDGASRGEGSYVSIRGLKAEYNVNLINGVTVAQGEPYSRQVKLSLLPPSGLNTIVLNKTSSADMDGDAIGGTVDFRTPTAFDYKDGTHASITASGRLESRARQYGDKGLGGGIAADLAHRFGADGQFGVYVSGYYDSRNYANSEVRGAVSALNDGGWAYLVGDKKGNSYAGLDPEQNATGTGIDVGVSNGSTHRYGGNASLDWKPDDTLHLYLRGTYARAKTQQNSTLSQFVSSAKSYNLVPNTDRYALSVDGISTRLYYTTNPETATLATAAFGGSKELGNWTISPEVFFSEGHNNRPNHIEMSARINQSDNFNKGQLRPLGGLSIGYTGNYPRPLFTQTIYDDLDNAGSRLLARRAGQLTESFSGQHKYGTRLDIAHDFSDAGGVLQSIGFGGKGATSHREVTNRDWTNAFFANLLGKGGVTWDQLGITKGNYDTVFPGEYNWSIPRIDQSQVFKYFYQYQTDASFDTCGSLYVNNYNCNTQKGDETVASAYAKADLKFGDLQVLPGVRYEHTAIKNTYWVSRSDAKGELPGFFDSNRTDYNVLLPSLFVNYRPTNDLVLRGDTWFSYTRPAFFQLGGGEQRSVGDDGKVTINRGNPNLKPIRAVNADLSGEWSYARAGYLMVGAYYKHLRDYLYDSGTGQTNQAEQASGQTLIYTPTNGGNGDVYGLEMQVSKKFVELPGLLSGFGVSGNLTRQWTKVDIGGGEMKRIQNAPNWMGDAQLLYARDGFSFDAIYHYSGSYIESYDYLGQKGGWDDRWSRAIHSVDLHTGYDFGQGTRVDLSVANVFNNYTYWAHVGKNSLALSDIVNSGRTALLTVKTVF